MKRVSQCFIIGQISLFTSTILFYVVHLVVPSIYSLVPTGRSLLSVKVALKEEERAGGNSQLPKLIETGTRQRRDVLTQSALECCPIHCPNGHLGQDLNFGGFAFALKFPILLNTNLVTVREELEQTCILLP